MNPLNARRRKLYKLRKLYYFLNAHWVARVQSAELNFRGLSLMLIFNFQLLPATTSTGARMTHVGGPCTEKDMWRCVHRYAQLRCPTLIYQHSTLV